MRGREALATGDTDAAIIWAGQAQGLIQDIPSCAELIARIIHDAEAIITERLGSISDAAVRPRS